MVPGAALPLPAIATPLLDFSSRLIYPATRFNADVVNWPTVVNEVEFEMASVTVFIQLAAGAMIIWLYGSAQVTRFAGDFMTHVSVMNDAVLYFNLGRE